MVIQSQPNILLTRPMAQSLRFASGLTGNVILSPLMQPEFLKPELPEISARAVVFTSETGVEAAIRLGWVLPEFAYCVGDQTAEVARVNGWQTVSAQRDAAALMAMILQQKESGPLLILRGEKTSRDLTRDLISAGIETVSAIIYRQNPAPLTVEAEAVLLGRNPVLVPLFSPQSARIFATEYRRIAATAPLCVVAMSGAVLAALQLPTHDSVIAARPDAIAMRRALDELMQRVVGA